MILINPKIFPKQNFCFLVSGGCDSIAAAHWLKHVYRKTFSVVHFNHKAQEANEQMEDRTIKFCVMNSIPVHVLSRNLLLTPKFDDNSEKTLREWRLHMLGGIGGSFITAHHLDDAVENYLMNCFHGNPLHVPIPWHTKFTDFEIYHPFLKTTKKDFENYANKHGLFCYITEDPTNQDIKQKRNWIRNCIVPQLDERDMGIRTIVEKKFYM